MVFFIPEQEKGDSFLFFVAIRRKKRRLNWAYFLLRVATLKKGDSFSKFLRLSLIHEGDFL
jgi:hypothetical protein